MPRIIVEADKAPERQGTVMLEERVVPCQIESDWFSAQLIEGVAWAVREAADAEARDSPSPPTKR
jgi:hypothetical protein